MSHNVDFNVELVPFKSKMSLNENPDEKNSGHEAEEVPQEEDIVHNIKPIDNEDEIHIWLAYSKVISRKKWTNSNIPYEVILHSDEALEIYNFRPLWILENHESAHSLLVGVIKDKFFILAKWQSAENNPPITLETIMDLIMEDKLPIPDRKKEKYKQHVFNYRRRKKLGEV